MAPLWLLMSSYWKTTLTIWLNMRTRGQTSQFSNFLVNFELIIASLRILEITKLSLYCRICFVLFFQDIFNCSKIEYTEFTIRYKILNCNGKYKHLNESQTCKALSNSVCFPILDYATTQYSLSIKEGMHTCWQKPAVHKHVDFLACSICV